MNNKLTITTVVVDGRCLDLLLTQDEIIEAHARAMHPDNKELLGDGGCSCWPADPDKDPCGFWDRLLNKCDCCKRL